MAVLVIAEDFYGIIHSINGVISIYIKLVFRAKTGGHSDSDWTMRLCSYFNDGIHQTLVNIWMWLNMGYIFAAKIAIFIEKLCEKSTDEKEKLRGWCTSPNFQANHVEGSKK